MLEKRVKKLLNPRDSLVSTLYAGDRLYFATAINYKGSSSKKRRALDIRPRHPALLQLEGWYETDIVVPEKYRGVYEEYKDSGSNVKLTRWALRNDKLSEEEASELGRSLVSTKFKLSCRHNDLLRLAETPHYATCMALNSPISKGEQQLQYLADPDIAVVVVLDKAGKYSWRSLARLVIEEGPGKEKFGLADSLHPGFALVMYRVYGNGPTDAIFAALDKKIHVYQAVDIRHSYGIREETGVEVKTSPTIHNNKFLSRPIWTDHSGVGWDTNRRIRIGVLRREFGVRYIKQDPGVLPNPHL